MGTWSDEPWGNDTAADWYAELMRKTKLPGQVRAALKLDPEENAEVVWAAVYTLLQFGHVYVWPSEHLEDDLRLGSDALSKLVDHPDIPSAQVKKSIRELKSRIAALTTAKTLATKQKAKPEPKPKVATPKSKTTTLKHLWSLDLIKPNRRTKAYEQQPLGAKNGTVLQLDQIDDRRLFAANGEWMAVVDSTTGKLIWRHDAIEQNTFMRYIFVAGTDCLVVSGPGGQTTLRDLRTGDKVKQLKHAAVTSASMSADGRRLIVMTFDETLEVYELPSGKHLHTLNHPVSGTKDTGHCVMTHDGKFAISKWQKGLAIWDLDSGQQIGAMAGVLSTRFTRDQQQLVCIKTDGAAVFDLHTGKIDRKLTKNQLRVGAHSPDGRFNVTLGKSRFHHFVSSVDAIDEATPVLQLDNRQWLDDRTLVLPYVSKEDHTDSGLQVWNIAPIEVVSSMRVDAALIAKACNAPNYQAHPDISRCLVDSVSGKVYAGDEDHHIHAFVVEC